MRTNELRRKPPACRGGDPVAALRKVPSGNSIALIALLVAALDQLTKSWAVNALDDRTIGIVWKLQFHLTSNTGFAFSTGQGLGPILGVIALGVMVVLWKVRTRSLANWQPWHLDSFWEARQAIFLIEPFDHRDGGVERSLTLSTYNFGPFSTLPTLRS